VTAQLQARPDLRACQHRMPFRTSAALHLKATHIIAHTAPAVQKIAHRKYTEGRIDTYMKEGTPWGGVNSAVQSSAHRAVLQLLTAAGPAQKRSPASADAACRHCKARPPFPVRACWAAALCNLVSLGTLGSLQSCAGSPGSGRPARSHPRRLAEACGCCRGRPARRRSAPP